MANESSRLWNWYWGLCHYYKWVNPSADYQQVTVAWTSVLLKELILHWKINLPEEGKNIPCLGLYVWSVCVYDALQVEFSFKFQMMWSFFITSKKVNSEMANSWSTIEK